MRVLVLGGAGFIGRHAVTSLLDAGHSVVIGSRHPARVAAHLDSRAACCERRGIRFERLGCVEHWQAPLEGVDAVLNCVGILRERGRETYEAVHLLAPTALARACRQRGLRLVHVSALGLNHPHRSRFLRSKLAAERMLAASGADYCLVRPSLLDGAGGFGAAWIRQLARLPLHLLPTGARGRIAAFDVRELGEALARLVDFEFLQAAGTGDREFELGGPQQRELAGYLQAIRSLRASSPAIAMRLPDWLARLCSHICDVLHFSPFSFGHWELLQQDNIPAPNRLPELLGRAPCPVGAPAAVAKSGIRSPGLASR